MQSEALGRPVPEWLHSSGPGVCVVDSVPTITYCNAPFARLLRVEPKALIGVPLASVFPAEAVVELEARRRAAALVHAPREDDEATLASRPMQGGPIPGNSIPGNPMPGTSMPGTSMPGSAHASEPLSIRLDDDADAPPHLFFPFWEVDAGVVTQGTLFCVEPHPLTISALGRALLPAAITRVSRDRKLTEREREVLTCMMRGHGAAEISETLGISVHTARNHTKAIYIKTGVGSQVELLLAVLFMAPSSR